jgi:hypothetical protein
LIAFYFIIAFYYYHFLSTSHLFKKIYIFNGQIRIVYTYGYNNTFWYAYGVIK